MVKGAKEQICRDKIKQTKQTWNLQRNRYMQIVNRNAIYIYHTENVCEQTDEYIQETDMEAKVQ